MHGEDQRLCLGHITYSNCYPVHAWLLNGGAPAGMRVVEGVPSTLNRMLDAGTIQVAPCSSIEFARHADRYRVLPDLVIGSDGPVRSILLLSRRDPGTLGAGATVAIPTASATSVVLLRVLLRTRWGAAPRFRWFDQARDDPFAGGADAALFIGDVALREGLHPELPVRLDLGAVWTEQTGLPFAFAVWQAGGGSDGDLRRLHGLLLESRARGLADLGALAAGSAERFGFPAERLAGYWRELRYDLDARMIEGLRTFYRMAAEAGEIAAEPELRWVG
jgi:chorismate dehydratase